MKTYSLSLVNNAAQSTSAQKSGVPKSKLTREIHKNLKKLLRDEEVDDIAKITIRWKAPLAREYIIKWTADETEPGPTT